MRYISPKEAAARWCISQRRVLILCEEGRIEGALRHSRVWLIPETAKKPADARIKSGRYIKKAQTSTPEKTKKNRNLLISVPFICPVPRMPPYFGRAFWKR